MSLRQKFLILAVILLAVLFPAACALAKTYYVRPGDSLWAIARKFGVTVNDLRLVNNLRGDTIYPGQRLDVPQGRIPDYEPLKRQINDYIAGKPATFGIYFKDLISGRSFGINEREPIHAASLVKVPVVLYLNTLAAKGQVDWQEKIAYNSRTDYQDGAGVLQFSARDGDKFSLRVLANLSITISDNIANRMLMRYLGRDNIAAFMRSLGGETVFPNGQNISTARDMGLYIQAVLDFYEQHPELGRRLLDDMANPIYHVGLPGELPERITVAHKEGDIEGVANDAGVVYGSRPYILVVMSKNIRDLDQAFADIARISRIAYDYQEQLAAQGY